MLTPHVCEFELRHPNGGTLPAFEPGAHLPVRTPSGLLRNYSLTGPSDDQFRYVIAVQLERGGEGGSASMVEDLREGNGLQAQQPRNAFELLASPRYVLLAGGIGITPLRAMFRHLIAAGSSQVHLVHLTRSRREAPYSHELQQLSATGASITTHHDDEDGTFDLWPLFSEPRDDTRVYCCGPPGLMAAVDALTVHWRPSRIHFERFSGVEGLDAMASPFTAVWEPTGLRVDVADDQTFLDALRAAGLPVQASCESGTCGTCRLRLVGGEALHRDMVLGATERESAVMPCVSRAAANEIIVAPPPR